MSRVTDFRSLVISADPERAKASARLAEYEFSAPGRRSVFSGEGGSEIIDNTRGVRVFYGRDRTSGGAYGQQPVANNGLTWNGRPITWNGIPLTWGED